MGAMAEAFAAYAQPLIDETDGSKEQLDKAFAISQLCYNLALLPEDSRDQFVSKMQSSLQMDDKAFDDFRRSHDSATPGDVPGPASPAFERRFAKRPFGKCLVGEPHAGCARRSLSWDQTLRSVSLR